MTYQPVAASAAATVGAVYFVGPGAVFSRVALRTVETELDCPTHRVADLDALRFARMSETGVVKPAFMVVVHESCARGLLAGLEQGADFLPATRIAVAFEDETTACAQFADICDALISRRVSLLPMNTNVTNWVRLLQVIQSGGQYMPPELLQASAGTSGAEGAGPQGPSVERDRDDQAGRLPQSTAPRRPEGRGRPPRTAASTGPMHPPTHGTEAPGADRLTPREAEVLEMAAAGRPNKTIAGELELSEHTVKLYMHRIIGKLGVRNRTEAAIWYHQNGGHA